MVATGTIGVNSLPFNKYIGSLGTSYTVSSTVMFRFTDITPSSLVAVTVYCVRLIISVGVPVICPVLLLNKRPADSSGDMLQSVTTPPVDTGDISTTLVLLSKLISLGM